MAKRTAPTQIVDEEEIVTVEVIVLPESTKDKALASLAPFRDALDEIKSKYENIIITDKTSLQFAEDGKRKLMKIRTGIEKKRKELTAPALEFQKSLKEFTDSLSAEIFPIEKQLSDSINAEQLRIENEKRAESQRRTNLIMESGYTLVGEFYRAGAYQVHFSDLETCTDEELTMYLDNGQRFLEAERVRLAEQARIEAELKEREAKIAAQEKELAEFRAWKAAQEQPTTFEVTTVQTEVVTLNQSERIQSAPIQDVTPKGQSTVMVFPPSRNESESVQSADGLTLSDVAELNGISYSELMLSLEVRVAYNTAIKDFTLRFEKELKTKAEWLVLLNQMKKK